MQAKNNLGWACYELGVKENIHVSGFDRGERQDGPFGAETKKLLFDSFKFGEARVIDEGTSSLYVLQLYDRARRVSETFEQAEPNIRALFENQKLEANRKRMRDGLLERTRITPESLFKDR
jgi:hypothetical protein